VLFLDRRLPDLDAEELSHTVRQRYPKSEVVLLDPESDAEPTTSEGKAGLLPKMWVTVDPATATPGRTHSFDFARKRTQPGEAWQRSRTKMKV